MRTTRQLASTTSRTWIAAWVLGLALVGPGAAPAHADEPAAPAPPVAPLPPAPPQAPAAVVVEDPAPAPCAAPAPERCCLPCDPALQGCDPKQCGDVYWGIGGSLLPNVGGYLQFGKIFSVSGSGTWAWEVQVGWQPIDDKDFLDNGDPSNDDYFDLQVGVKHRSDPGSRRHWVCRAGAFVLDAGSEPNWADTPGVWAGGYVGFGFETDITPNLSIGPTLTLMAGAPVEEDGPFNVIPQLTWGLTWWPGCGTRCNTCACLPKGEVYVDLGVAVLPGAGPSIGFGQVFARKPGVVWSFEATAVFQTIEAGTLQGESDGDLAQLQGGFKAMLNPCGRHHLVLRAGATWLRTTGEVETLEEGADYVGAYASVGYEFDIGTWFTTGPELHLSAVAQEGDSEFEFVPRLGWHFIIKL